MFLSLWSNLVKAIDTKAEATRGNRRRRVPQRFRRPLWCEPLEARITPADHFVISAPATATAGTAFNFTVVAEDSTNTLDPTYSGTVHFTSTDGAALLPANSTLTAGTGLFSATLKTAGSQTITGTDTVDNTITGTSNPIDVSAAAATHFAVSAPSSATAGTAFSFTVTAQDQFNNTDTGYSGTVHFTSTDSAAVLPSNSTLTNGVGTFNATLKTAGAQTLTATDTVTSSITGTSSSITVSAAAATHFVVSAPSSATAGTAFNFTVTAEDQFDNTATSYAGTVHFTSSDGAATLPANSSLTNGVGTFSATLETAGSQTITATDTVTSSITGTSNTIAVSAAAATHFAVSAPSSATAGTAFNFTVTAEDQFNNTDTAYAGTVHFTSSDGAATLPANSTLTNGTGTFSATLDTAGGQTLTATDTTTSSITGSAPIDVSAAAATHFAVSAPSSATAGTAFSFTVTAEDQFNNTDTAYAGTVHFTSSDGAAVLPANSTLTNGTGTFSATLKTAGSQTITATDTTTSSITGTSNTIDVSAAAATHFTVSAPAGATAGTAFNFTVTALDQFNNTDTGYAGTVHFTSSDGAASLPANSTLTNGTGTFSATLNTDGFQTITATDTVTSSVTGTSNTIAVSAAATHFVISAPSSATAGNSFSITVTAEDASNNTAIGYTGTVHFTSSDSQAVLPADATLTDGVGTFMVTMKTAGSQTVTATDTTTSSITGTSSSITVSAAAATHFTVSAPSSATAGTAFSFTVTAEDQFDNTDTSYAGTVHFTSTDGSAVLPNDSTLTSGVGSFNATLKTAGSQTLTATDTTTSSITGTSNSITVSPAAATHLVVSAPSSATAGTAFSFTVTAEDQFNNTDTSYAGTVHFTSSDGQAVLPSDSTLTNGVGTFDATLKTAGAQTLTATDTVTSSITGTSSSITVSPTAATHFAVSAPSTATTGTPFNITVTAEDQFDNTATSYTGTVHFTSTDGTALLPSDSLLTNGVGTFSARLDTPGNQTISATDTANSSLTGTSNTIAVSAAVTHFVISAPSSATAGNSFTITVTAEDASNNTVTGYTGTVHFTSSDGQAVLPANAMLTNGVGTFTVTLKTAGNQTVTATDITTSSLTGTSNAITVSAAAATHFVVSAPSTATVGTAVSFTVTAEDQFDNTDTSYTGTVHFTSTDSAAVLPSDSTLTNGTGTFSATFGTAGTQTLTATDTATSSLTGTSGSITVSPPVPPVPPPPPPASQTPFHAGVFDPATATWTLDLPGTGNASASDATFHFGAVGDTGIIGDWNGGGFQEIGVYRVDTSMTDPTSGKHPLVFALDVNGNGTFDPGSGDVAFAFGLEGDTVVVGDWLGDGVDRIGVVRPGVNGVLVWSLNTSTGSSGSFAVFSFGLNGDEPIVGKWSGGKTEIGTVRSQGGALVWSLDFNGDGAFDAGDKAYTFGLAGDMAVLGDWNGNGTTKIGVFRTDPNGVTLDFALDTNGDGTFSSSTDLSGSFGLATDNVLVGDWNGNGLSKIGTSRHSSNAQDILFSEDVNGDLMFDTGDIASTTGLPGGASAQSFAGQWKGNT